MVEFRELRYAPLAGIDGRAGAFEALVRGWEFSSELTGDVIVPLQGSGWRGPAAEQAAEAIAKVRTQIDAAFEEATGLARALRDAHTELVGAQEDLKVAIKSAVDQGMTVDDAGAVNWPSATSAADKNDPDYANSYRQRASKVADAIAKAVARATEADAAAALALAADTGVSRTSFNAKPLGGLAEEEAREAADILRLAGGATDTQLARLDQMLKAHAGDPRFATAFYASLGPDGFLKSYGQLTLASGRVGGNRPQAIADLQAGLGTALATATSTRNQPHLADAWEAGLRKAGSTRFDVWPVGQPGGGAQPYGYQILTNILRTGTYDPHFLNPLAEHVTQLSGKQGFFTLDRWNAAEFEQMKYLGAGQGGFNPMVGVLEALGRNPEAALRYFHDSATIYDLDGTVQATGWPNRYVEMLSAGGDNSPLQDVWKDHVVPMGHAESPGVIAFGHALEAATLGRVHDAPDAPLPRHTPEMADVMKRVVDSFGNGDGPKLLGKSAAFASLDASLGHMTAGYMGDVQSALNAQDTTLTTYGVRADLNQANTEKLLGALGRNPESYGAIAQAQQAYTTAHIQDVILHREDYKDLFGQAVDNAARPGGVVAGILTAARTEALVGAVQADAAAYNKSVDQNAIWAKSLWAMSGGRMLGNIPVVGAGLSLPVNGFIDSVAATYHVDPRSADQATSSYDAGMTSASLAAKQAVEMAAQGTGMSERYVEALATSAANNLRAGASDGATLFGQAIRG
ncbi:hypothetical protein [Kitasatospora sp. NPDC090091]|uniref:hypothetical protein n=1 Tax=Kitasatospora sp. NPDC090091 TaxID=3364081 RepID=UPI003808CA5C